MRAIAAMGALLSCLGCQLISGVGDFGFAGAGASAGNAGGDGGGGNGGHEGGSGGGAPNDFLVRWVQPLGASGPSTVEAADASSQQGLVSVVGGLDGQLDLGEGAISATKGMFAAKLNRDGDAVFAEPYEASTGAMPFVVAESTALTAGGSYVAGRARGAVDFGNGVSFDVLSTSVFVAKLDQDGVGVWVTTFNQTGLGTSSVLGIGVGSTTVTIGGTLDDAVLATSGCTPVTVGGATQRQGYFIVLDADLGDCIQARSYGSAGNSVRIRDLTARNETLYFVGDYEGSPNIVGTGMLPSSDETNFIASASIADPDAAPLFTPLSFPGVGNDAATHIAVFAEGIAVMGFATGKLTTLNGELSPIGNTDAWVASLSPMASPRWTRRFGAPGKIQVPGGIAIDEGGIMAGISCSGPVDFGRGPVGPSEWAQACVAVWQVESDVTMLSGAWGPEATIKGAGSLGSSTLTIAGYTTSTVDFGLASVTATGAESRAFVIAFTPLIR